MGKNVEIRSEQSSDQSPATGGSSDLNFKRYYPAIILTIAALFFAYDIVADILVDRESVIHVLIESLVFFAVSTLAVVELKRASRLSAEVLQGQDQIARLSGELLTVMRNQFTEWELSPSESEVALLLIKGLSMKEISEARQVKEKTVRQQATGIYVKSQCAGRHELAAYFIEDLMSHEAL